jgi:DNA-binding CsgD family transcriptional regulator
MSIGARSGRAKEAGLRQEVVRLAHAGHDLPTLLDETVRVLRKAIPCEAGCWHALDPTTLLETSYKAVNLPIENPLAAEIEYVHDDYNQFATLARGPQHSAILSVATEGIPERSLRYRELIRPLGLEGELRAAFVDSGAAWGSVCLLREHSSRDFSNEEALLLQEVSPDVGRGIRTALLLQAASASTTGAHGPGLILFDDHQRLDAITPSAEHFLEELAELPNPETAPRDDLPYVVHAVAAKARFGRGARNAQSPARAHVRTSTGNWLVLHGCFIAGPVQKRTAVIVERAAKPGLAPSIRDAYGLTGRESELVRHLLQGFSTKQIATALCISPYTVQEHFSKVFDKVGVRSRRELVAKLFSQIYGPRIQRNHPFAYSDWFSAYDADGG